MRTEARRSALVVLFFFVGVANAQSCKPVVINTNSTTNGMLASEVPRVAQRLDVQADLTRRGTRGPSSTTAYAYRTQIEASTLTQSFSHFHQATPMSFAGLNFTARHGTVKWTLNFTAAAVDTTNHSLTSNAQRNGFTIRYRVADLSTLRSPTAEQWIFRRDDTPQAGITTFYVALPKTSGGSVDDAAAQLEVLGLALVDDAVVPLTHMSLAVATESAEVAGANNGSYVLELGFPPFTRFVVYDPSLGLGVLIGRPGEGGSSSSSDLGLILGVAVGCLWRCCSCWRSSWRV